MHIVSGFGIQQPLDWHSLLYSVDVLAEVPSIRGCSRGDGTLCSIEYYHSSPINKLRMVISFQNV